MSRARPARRGWPAWLALAVVSVVAVEVSPIAPAQSLDVIDREFSKLVEEISPSAVRIGNGMTGVCVSDKGHILTHIVVGRQLSGQGDGATVMVSFADQQTFAAALIQLDEATGTSLLRIGDRRRFPSARPGLASSLEVGHLLITIGNSLNSAAESAPAATLGVLSAIHRDPKGRAALFETSAATNPGQTGSPFFDVEGALIGLARSLPTDQDLATVVPIDRILDAYQDVDERDHVFNTLLTSSPSRSSAQVLSQAFAIAARRARPGVVTLNITRPEPETNIAAADVAPDSKAKRAPDGKSEEGAVPPLIPRRDGPLSATIVDPRGFLLAPLAELDGEIASINALLDDGRSYRASLVARDRKAGLALLVMDKPASAQLAVLPLRDQSDLEPGQFVIAVGAPHGTTAPEGAFATVGILSARHRLDPWRDALQTDAGVNVKNAGGVLVDLRGRQVGVILPPEAPYGQNSGLGFAMPMDAVARSLTRLMEGVDVEAAYLGVRLGDTDEGGRGAVVIEVYEGFPAFRAGVRVGDLITALDDKVITQQSDLSDYLYGRKTPGDPVSITVLRDRASTELFAVLAKRPD